MKPKFYTLILVFLISLIGCSRQINLVMVENNPPDSTAGLMDQKFISTVESLSKGKIRIKLFANGEMGNEVDCLKEMTSDNSNIDLARISPYSLSSIGLFKNRLLSIPFTFKSREHYWNFAKSDLGKDFLMEPLNSGKKIRGLFYSEEGFRHFFSKTKLENISDFKGLNIRISNDVIMNGIVESLNAKSVYMPISDIYAAFKLETIDCAEQPIVNYKAHGFSEIAPYVLLDAHTIGAVEVVMTEKAWNKLSQKQKDIIMEASEIASEFCRRISVENEYLTVQELSRQGVTFTEISDVAPWRKICDEVVQQASKFAPEEYKKILEMGE